jgi:hypothetical protein
MKNPTFHDFNFLLILSNYTFHVNWFSNFNGGEEEVYLAFLFVGGKYFIYQTNDDGYVGFEPITKDVFNKVITKGPTTLLGTTHAPLDHYFILRIFT